MKKEQYPRPWTLDRVFLLTGVYRIIGPANLKVIEKRRKEPRREETRVLVLVAAISC